MQRALSQSLCATARSALTPAPLAAVAAAAVAAPSCVAAARRALHSSSLVAHNRPEWPLRSAAHFREKAESERAARLAAFRARQASQPPAYAAAHPHPAPLPAEAFTPVEGRRTPPAHFAVFRFRNEQFKAVEDDQLMVNRVSLPVGSRLLLPQVLLLGGRDATLIGRPHVAGALVVARVEEHTSTAKVVVFKKKRRKGYKKKMGHRDRVSVLRVEQILLPAGQAALTTGAPVQHASEELLQQAEQEDLEREMGTKALEEEAEQTQASAPALPATTVSAAAAAVAAATGKAPMGARAFSTYARASAAPARSFSTTAAAAPPTTESSIRALLQSQLQASVLEVEDTSGGCGAFFRLLVVSPQFAALSLVKQHRLVNETLKAHIANLHGLQITTFTEEQWKQRTSKQH